MCDKNDAQKRADAVRRQFTIYLKKAIEYKRRDYIERELRYKAQVTLTDFKDAAVVATIEKNCALYAIELNMETGNERLEEALMRLNSRETLILYARAIKGEDFESLAKRLGISVNGAYSAYHRLTSKLRKILGGKTDAF